MPSDQHEESVEPTGDVEMSETQNTQETAPENIQETGQDAEGEQDENADETALTSADSQVAEPRVTFVNYLMSPIVTLLIGSGDQSILTAHQGLLTQSPYFKGICDSFVEDGSVGNPMRCTPQIILTPCSPARLSSQTTTSTLSAASSSTSTPASTSPRSSQASASSNPTLRSPQSTTAAISSSSTPVSTPLPRSLVSTVSRHSRAPRSTASTPQPRARSHTLVMSTPSPATTTPPSALPWQASGPRAHTPFVPRPRRSSRLFAWSIPSSDTMFSVYVPTR